MRGRGVVLLGWVGLLVGACTLSAERFEIVEEDSGVDRPDAAPTLRDGGAPGVDADPGVDAPTVGSDASDWCVPPVELACGAPGVMGSTRHPGTPDEVDTYDCTIWQETGPEVLYRFTAPTAGTYLVRISGLAASTDLDVFVLAAGCPATDCIEFGDDDASFTADPGDEFTIAVDGFQGAEGEFTLTVTCP